MYSQRVPPHPPYYSIVPEMISGPVGNSFRAAVWGPPSAGRIPLANRGCLDADPVPPIAHNGGGTRRPPAKPSAASHQKFTRITGTHVPIGEWGGCGKFDPRKPKWDTKELKDAGNLLGSQLIHQEIGFYFPDPPSHV